jgi:hypothetical protein
VFRASDRCNQENLHAQLKGEVRALQVATAPVWNLKSWLAQQVSEQPRRWAERHRTERKRS